METSGCRLVRPGWSMDASAQEGSHLAVAAAYFRTAGSSAARRTPMDFSGGMQQLRHNADTRRARSDRYVQFQAARGPTLYQCVAARAEARLSARMVGVPR